MRARLPYVSDYVKTQKIYAPQLRFIHTQTQPQCMCMVRVFFRVYILLRGALDSPAQLMHLWYTYIQHSGIVVARKSMLLLGAANHRVMNDARRRRRRRHICIHRIVPYFLGAFAFLGCCCCCRILKPSTAVICDALARCTFRAMHIDNKCIYIYMLWRPYQHKSMSMEKKTIFSAQIYIDRRLK